MRILNRSASALVLCLATAACGSEVEAERQTEGQLAPGGQAEVGEEPTGGQLAPGDEGNGIVSDDGETVGADSAEVTAVAASLAPGGRRFWSASYGRFVTGDNPWVRNARFTLTPTTATSGSVSATLTQWNGPAAPKRAVAGGTGPSNGMPNCNVLKPTPERSMTWTGTYAFAGTRTAGSLSFKWSNGAQEEWKVDELRGGTLGRMTMTSAIYQGSDPNRGVGYGTKLPFTVYKTVGQVDSVGGIFKGGFDVHSPVAVKFSAWNLNIGDMQRTSSTSKTISVTQSLNKAGVDPSSCKRQDIKGNIYNLLVSNGGRLMTLNHYWRCLVNAETGCYANGMHTDMLDQVIDDNNNLVGVVGVEASTSGGYTYARIDALLP